MREYRFIIALFILASISLAACKSDSTSGNGTANGLKGPQTVGNWYLYRAITLDSTGAIIAVDSTHLSGDTVLATGISQGNEADVIQLTPNFLFEFLKYESNGDLSYFVSQTPSHSGGWATAPLATKGKQSSGIEYSPRWYSIQYTYTGIGSHNVGGVTFTTESFDVGVDDIGHNIYAPYSREWYDASSRILVEVDYLAQRGANGKLGNGSGYQLVQFHSQ